MAANDPGAAELPKFPDRATVHPARRVVPGPTGVGS